MSVLGRVLRFPLRFMPPGMVLPVLSGPLRGRRWIVGAATHGSWLGTYERLAQRVFVNEIRAGDVVYDIGANTGFLTLLASKLAGPDGAVYAFEPVDRNIAFLREHVRLNRAANVHIMPIAVADRPGLERFASGSNPAMGGLSATGDLQVTTATLDDLGLPAPAFIKMDIEGAEDGALAGAAELLRRHQPVILLSEHGFDRHERCSALLRTLGYDLTLLVDGASDGNYVVLAKGPRLNSASR